MRARAQGRRKARQGLTTTACLGGNGSSSQDRGTRVTTTVVHVAATNSTVTQRWQIAEMVGERWRRRPVVSMVESDNVWWQTHAQVRDGFSSEERSVKVLRAGWWMMDRGRLGLTGLSQRGFVSSPGASAALWSRRLGHVGGGGRDSRLRPC